jgi:hypothetical protein
MGWIDTEKVKRRMERDRLTHEALARRIGRTRQCITRILSCGRTKASTAQALGDALGFTDYRTLLKGGDAYGPTTQDDRA